MLEKVVKSHSDFLINWSFTSNSVASLPDSKWDCDRLNVLVHVRASVNTPGQLGMDQKGSGPRFCWCSGVLASLRASFLQWSHWMLAHCRHCRWILRHFGRGSVEPTWCWWAVRTGWRSQLYPRFRELQAETTLTPPTQSGCSLKEHKNIENIYFSIRPEQELAIPARIKTTTHENPTCVCVCVFGWRGG